MTIENLIIYTYNNAVETAKELQDDLGCRRIASSSARAARSIPANTLVVNWGYGRVPDWSFGQKLRYINHPNNVRRKMSKVGQLTKFQAGGVPTFEFTTAQATAKRWYDEGDGVLVRREESYGGRGIEVVRRVGAPVAGEFPHGDFYTKFFNKTHEYRFHVFNDEVIDVVQKKRLFEAKPLAQLSLTEQTVRNYANGWIEAHKDLYFPGDSRDRIAHAARAAVRSLGLDFGAADIIVEYDGGQLRRMAVCEVNTAPGLGEIERAAYTKAILKTYKAQV